MQVIIVGHHSRSAQIAELQRALPDAACFLDIEDRGAAYGHRQALKLAAGLKERCVIMEDDAIPVVGFEKLAEDWLRRHPDDLLSFYLGTGRPPQWQRTIDVCLRTTRTDYICLPELVHGVCYSIPQWAVKRVAKEMTAPEADFAIGRAWGRPTFYPVESLVEHRDGVPVERHPDGQPRTERRVARKLAGPLMFDR